MVTFILKQFLIMGISAVITYSLIMLVFFLPDFFSFHKYYKKQREIEKELLKKWIENYERDKDKKWLY